MMANILVLLEPIQAVRIFFQNFLLFPSAGSERWNQSAKICENVISENINQIAENKSTEIH